MSNLEDLIKTLNNIMAKLRYVTKEDYILPEDHNLLVDCIKTIRNILNCIREKAREWGVSIDSKLDDLLKTLDNIISKLRYVEYGDYVITDDHNLLVDSTKTIRDIIDVLKQVFEIIKIITLAYEVKTCKISYTVTEPPKSVATSKNICKVSYQITVS